MVEYEGCPGCESTGEVPDLDYPLQDPAEATKRKTCGRCKGERFRLLVTRPAGGTARFALHDPGDVERAYKMALHGPVPVPQPPTKDFGEVPF